MEKDAQKLYIYMEDLWFLPSSKLRRVNRRGPVVLIKNKLNSAQGNASWIINGDEFYTVTVER